MQTEQEQRWLVAQSKEDTFWKKNGVVGSQMRRVISRYAPVITEISDSLKPDSTILDVGCGPTCAAQLFITGRKSYLDPLMDSYSKTHSGTLPQGEKICSIAESIPFRDESFDVVLCVNALDHMIDPVKASVEMHRVLKKNGVFVLGIFLHPPLLHRARRFIECFLPMFKDEAHPHGYTLRGIRPLLGQFFSLEREVRVFKNTSSLFPSLHREDWMFICRKK